VTGLLFEDHRI